MCFILCVFEVSNHWACLKEEKLAIASAEILAVIVISATFNLLSITIFIAQ